MAHITESIYNIKALDELANQKSPIHEIHPLGKLLVTILYLIVVISFDKYEISQLIPLFFYPIIMMGLGEIPIIPMIKRLTLAAPFVVGVGIFNPILDRGAMLTFMGITVSGGWLSFFSLLIKCTLTVLAALLLLATTGIDNISAGLRLLRVPRIFVMQLLLTYRYITILMEEASVIWNAYMLRAPGEKTIKIKVWSSLAGQMLLRTYERAQGVYQAMVLRGFHGEYHTGATIKFKIKDLYYCLGWAIFLFATKYLHIPAIIGRLLTGVGK